MSGRPACGRLTYLLGGKKHALGLKRIQGKIEILRLWPMLGETTVKISHPFVLESSSLTAQWVMVAYAF